MTTDHVLPEACSDGVAGPDGHCITCGDEATSMQVMLREGCEALCQDGSGARHRVAVDLVGEVEPGDTLLVHAGVAIRALGGAQ